MSELDDLIEHLLANADSDRLQDFSQRSNDEVQRRGRLQSAHTSHMRAINEARTNAGPIIPAEPIPVNGHAPGQRVEIDGQVYVNVEHCWNHRIPPAHGWDEWTEPEPNPTPDPDPDPDGDEGDNPEPTPEPDPESGEPEEPEPEPGDPDDPEDPEDN